MTLREDVAALAKEWVGLPNGAYSPGGFAARLRSLLEAHPEDNSHWYVSPQQWDRLRKLLVTKHEHPEGMNECAICDESLVDAAAKEIKQLRANAEAHPSVHE